jgi:hypothetical protein
MLFQLISWKRVRWSLSFNAVQLVGLPSWVVFPSSSFFLPRLESWSCWRWSCALCVVDFGVVWQSRSWGPFRLDDPRSLGSLLKCIPSQTKSCVDSKSLWRGAGAAWETIRWELRQLERSRAIFSIPQWSGCVGASETWPVSSCAR